jgi:hypothetical protein
VADRRVTIELNITANAQQAQQIMRGMFGGGGGGGGGGGKGGGFTDFLAAIALSHPTAGKAANAVAVAAGGPFGFLAAGAVMAAGAIYDFSQKLIETSVSLSKIANPAQATLYEMAVADLYGVIGQRLTPVVELATDAMRMFGDFLASVLPSSAEVRMALAPLKEALNTLKGALVAIVPVVRDFLLRALLELARAFAFVAGFLGALFGTGGGQFPASGRGAAARPAQMFGDINSAIEAMNVAALSGASIEEVQAGYLEEIRDWCLRVEDAITGAKRAGAQAGNIVTGNTAGQGWLGDWWWGFTHPREALGLAE